MPRPSVSPFPVSLLPSALKSRTIRRVSAGKNERPRLVVLLSRHAAAIGYVLRVVLPVILRTGRRPVIFSRPTGMGDIICTIPAARGLMRRHPGATFIYNCHADFAAIPRLAGIANRITSLEPIGIVGHWYRFLLAGFYHFAHGDDLPDAGCQEPMVTEFLRQFGLPISDEHPELPIDPEARQRAFALIASKNLSLDSLVLIHPGPSWPVREWPRENWTQLVAALRERGYTNIAQLGVGRYMNFGKVEVPTIPGTVSLLDAFTVEECIAAIAQAKLFIGIDSGLLHIAAGTRTPAVGIFGMTLPEFRFSKHFRKDFVVNRVPCAGCEHRKPRLHWVTGCPYDIKCMRTLPVDDVLRACLAKLQPAALDIKNEPNA
jgi:ADP-heptose:LPS heptosyltransferase